ncbi:unnamed protein product [Phytophthora fragariaefolia]|uniref:RxLR effector protein n=1 Tax=Phytophthora fragariaefolia TaxID=1490495 RepID=A0A9W6YMV2_9STRA|nr:unnamed protein product [Phytophthora fragariaefolia]
MPILRLLDNRYYTRFSVALLDLAITVVHVAGDLGQLDISTVVNTSPQDILTADEKDVPRRRMLRAGNDDEDERAISIPSLTTITETAKKIPGASTVAEVAKKLPGASLVGGLAQKLQYQYWLKMKKTPEEVKTILGLDDMGTKILIART